MISLRTLTAAGGLGLALAVASSFSTPVDASGFTLTGESLGLGQRDFQVFNNFSDRTANDNTTPDPDFPGATGAVQAIWKAHLEWASEPYMLVGDQDPTQATLGDGGANFDNTFQGQASSPGDTNGNVHSELFDPTPGSVGAFIETPVSDGWRIRYLSSSTWQDGPGDDGALDLQGVATRLVGLSLGLASSGVTGATMGPLIGNGVPARSIEDDDIAGIQAIYGVKSASKPRIAGISGSTNTGGTLTIQGENFAAAGNEVWFTAEDGDGTPAKVLGVAATAGGTLIDVIVPEGVEDGGLLVRNTGVGGESLSNEWPFDHDPGVFVDLGPSGIGGTLGEPVLAGAGDLTPGGSGTFTITCTNAMPSATGFVFLSDEVNPTPFFGGTFYPFPIVAQMAFPFDVTGELAVTTSLDASIPGGTSIALQFFFLDASGPFGVTGSNGLRADVP